MPPDTLRRWIRQGRMPVKWKGDKCIFSTRMIKSWAADNHLKFTLPGDTKADNDDLLSSSLVTAMETGGVHYGLSGDTVAGVLHEAVARIGDIIGESAKPALIKSLLEREEMMSTGIGHGVAVPHPRKPLAGIDAPPLIATCFLQTPVDFDAIDHKPVHVMFLLVAPDSRSHLYLLSRTSYCIRDVEFRGLLASVPDKKMFIEKVGEIETLFGKSHA
ncbi:MAG: PTS sugar transporter subunit IIA [Deltaproteobacteria bacterium]|nr:PTS sugar transporter subunit IIA [Deltaproteobacteria bacterium]